MIDYFSIIHKYIPPDSLTYRYYLPHVILVTHRALSVAKRLALPDRQIQFIEEAAMLHDIGIVRVQAEKIGCYGKLPYLCHGVEGRNILEAEGLPQHALVAERHTGVGISKVDIITNAYPLPQRDMLAESLAEQIISWADLFYSKNPKKIWYEQSKKKIRKGLAVFGPDKTERFDQWRTELEPGK